jgi:hypothetical protein
MSSELTAAVIETARLSAWKLTGPERRAFQAEMAERYCGSSPRLAEEVFGWGREAVRTGLGGAALRDSVSGRFFQSWPEDVGSEGSATGRGDSGGGRTALSGRSEISDAAGLHADHLEGRA